GIVTRGCGPVSDGPVSDGPVSDGPVSGDSVSDGCGAGRRPSMSSQFSAGVRAITLVKLTFSLAAVMPTMAASKVMRADRGRQDAEAPSIAPSAFAPASPSI